MIRKTWLEMGMPVTVCIRDESARKADIDPVVDLLSAINGRFSPYLSSSEVSRLNSGALSRDEVSDELATILELSAQTKSATDGYFDIGQAGGIDPSGIVKGWAIQKSSDLLLANGWRNFFVDAGGDIQAVGLNGENEPWRVGIRNPFDRLENVKILAVTDCGVATSGIAIRGHHIWNPIDPDRGVSDVVSLTVIAPTIFEADCMATAAFAMGRAGITFIANRPELEGYLITSDGIGTFTKGFSRYVR